MLALRWGLMLKGQKRRRELDQARAAVEQLEQVLRDAAGVVGAPVSAEDLESELTDVAESPVRPAR